MHIYWYIPAYLKKVEPKISTLGDNLQFSKHSASFHVLTCANTEFLLELKERLLLIMRDQQFLIRSIKSPSCIWSVEPNKIFVRTLFVFDSCYISLLNELFFILSIRSAWVPLLDDFTFQFTSLVVISLSIIKFKSAVLFIQMQPFRSVLGKRCSENMQQIYRKTLIPKCDFNKVVYYNCFPFFFIIIVWKWTKQTCPNSRLK